MLLDRSKSRTTRIASNEEKKRVLVFVFLKVKIATEK